jgi:hypothetical protein
MNTIDWKVILLVFGLLLTITTTSICLTVWWTCKMIGSLKLALDYQNQRFEEVIKCVYELKRKGVI